MCIGLAATPWLLESCATPRLQTERTDGTVDGNFEVAAHIVANLIAIPLSIGPSGPLLFEIGTAADGIHLRRNIAADLRLTAPLGADREETQATTVSVGGRRLRDRAVVVRNDAWALPPPLHGIVGLDVFGELSVELNFRRRRLRIGPAELPPPDGRTIFSYAGAERVSVPVRIGALSFPAIVDTGQIRSPLLMNASLAERIGGERRRAGEVTIGGTSVALTELVIEETAFVGTTPLHLPSAIYPGPTDRNNLGALALRDLALAIDQRRKRVQLRPG